MSFLANAVPPVVTDRLETAPSKVGDRIDDLKTMGTRHDRHTLVTSPTEAAAETEGMERGGLHHGAAERHIEVAQAVAMTVKQVAIMSTIIIEWHVKSWDESLPY